MAEPLGVSSAAGAVAVGVAVAVAVVVVVVVAAAVAALVVVVVVVVGRRTCRVSKRAEACHPPARQRGWIRPKARTAEGKVAACPRSWSVALVATKDGGDVRE